MKFAILAAGEGKRLGKRGETSPKALIEVGGRPIIELSIENLISSGAQEIAVVAGHCGSRLTYLGSKYSNVEVIFNPQYLLLGSLGSLAVAFTWARDDLVFLDSDIIYEPRAVELIVESRERNTVLVTDPGGGGDEVWVYSCQNKLEKLTKERSVDSTPIGEFVGISRLTKDSLEMIVSFENQRKPQISHEYEAFFAYLAQFVSVHPRFEPGLIWAEIDTVEHLARAIELVYPQIVAARG